MTDSDIDVLNKRFGAPGRIAFRRGEAGFPVAALVSRYGTCEVSLYGGHVLSYRRPDTARSCSSASARATSRASPSAAASRSAGRGSAPAKSRGCPCTASPASRRWDLRATEYSSDVTELRLSLTDSEQTRRLWPLPSS
jgi:glucose-6-phosphate 1-epimerase